MKLFAILLTLWLATASFCIAQDLLTDPAVKAAVADAVPAKYVGIVNSVILALMILGRGLTALANGRGIKGWLSAIVNGTNGPAKVIIVALCLLSLPSCTASVDWKLLGKQAGQAAIDAAAPIVVRGITTPAKQPQNVQP